MQEWGDKYVDIIVKADRARHREYATSHTAHEIAKKLESLLHQNGRTSAQLMGSDISPRIVKMTIDIEQTVGEKTSIEWLGKSGFGICFDKCNIDINAGKQTLIFQEAED